MDFDSPEDRDRDKQAGVLSLLNKIVRPVTTSRRVERDARATAPLASSQTPTRVVGGVHNVANDIARPFDYASDAVYAAGLGAAALPKTLAENVRPVLGTAGKTLGRVVAPLTMGRIAIDSAHMLTDKPYLDSRLNAYDDPGEGGVKGFLTKADPARLPSTLVSAYGAAQALPGVRQDAADSGDNLRTMARDEEIRSRNRQYQQQRQEIMAGGVGSPNKALSRMWPSSTPQNQEQGLAGPKQDSVGPKQGLDGPKQGLDGPKQGLDGPKQGLAVPKQELTQPTKDTPSGTPSTPKPSWSSTPKPVETKFGSVKLEEPVKRPRIEHDDVCPNCGEVIREKGSWPLRTKAGKQVRLGDRLVERHSACGGNFLWPESSEELSPEWQGLRELGKASLLKDSVTYDEWLAEQPAEKKANVATDLQEARKQTETKPTEAQIEADNYRHGKIVWQGLTISLENPKSSTRSGTSKSGKKWSTLMRHDYGRFLGTVGADKDHVDCFVGPDHKSEIVYVVDQDCPDTGKFDEAKVMICFGSEEAARQGYLDNYEKGWRGLGDITALTIPQLKWWLAEGQTTKPIKGQLIKAAAHEALIGGGLGALAGALGGGLAAQQHNQEVAETGEGEKVDVLDRALNYGMLGGAGGAALGYGASALLAGSAKPGKGTFFPDGKAKRDLEVPNFDTSKNVVDVEKALSHWYQHVDGGWQGVRDTASRAVRRARIGGWFGGKGQAVDDPEQPFVNPAYIGKSDPGIRDLGDLSKDMPRVQAFDAGFGRTGRVEGTFPEGDKSFKFDIGLGTYGQEVAMGFESPGLHLRREQTQDVTTDLILGHEGRHAWQGQTEKQVEGLAGLYIAKPGELTQALGQLKAETAWLTGRVINTAGDFRQLMDETGVTGKDKQKFKEMQLKYSPEGARMLNYMRTLYIKDPAAYDKAIHEMGAVDLFRQVVMGESEGEKTAAVRQGILDDVPVTGPEAIQHALGKLDLGQLEQEQRQMLARKIKTKRGHAARVLGIIDGLRRNDVQPRDLMITKVPVLPAQFRPFSVVGETFTPGDANEMYKDLISYRDMYSKSVKELGHEGSTDAWNGMRQALRAVYGFDESPNPKSQTRNVRGFLEHLTGVSPKESFFQRKLLSKPQDSVARGVIVPDPDLGMDEIGVPEEMLWPMYGSHIQRRMVRAGMSPIDALKHVRDRSETAKRALLLEMPERPVVYSRSPAWHRFNVLSGTPKMTDGHAIQLSPLVTTGLTADFDGDCKSLKEKDLWLVDGVVWFGRFEELLPRLDTRFPVQDSSIFDVAAGRLKVVSFQDGLPVWLPVSAVHFHTKHKASVRVTLRSGMTLDTTDDHGMMTFDDDMNLKQVCPRDLVGRGIVPVVHKIPMPVTRTTVRVGDFDLSLDYDLGYVVGHYLGDGGAYDSTKEVRLTSVDPAHLDCMRDRLQCLDMFPRRDMPYGEGIKGFALGDVCLWTWFRDQFGSGSYDKRMAAWILGAPEVFQRGVLDGVLSTDGRVKVDKIVHKGRFKSVATCNIGLVNADLIDDLAVLCRCLGVSCSREFVGRADVPHTKLHMDVSDAPWLELTHPGRQEQLLLVRAHADSASRGYLKVVPWNKKIQREIMHVLGWGIVEARKQHALFSSSYIKKGYASRFMAREFLSGNNVLRTSEMLRKWVDLVQSETVHCEVVEHVDALPREDLTFDVTVPGPHMTVCPVSGIVTHQTMNIHVPASHDAVEEARTILKPSSMPFSIRNPDKLVPTLKHEQVLGLYDAANSPSKRTHKFADKEQALAAIRQGTVDLSDELEIGLAATPTI